MLPLLLTVLPLRSLLSQRLQTVRSRSPGLFFLFPALLCSAAFNTLPHV